MSFTLWFTGLSGSGKTTLSTAVHETLHGLGAKAELLDGDLIRALSPMPMGFSEEQRQFQIRQLGLVSYFLNKNGIISIVAAISPYAATREANRKILPNYLEIYCRCDLATLERRDTKGLYAKARLGLLQGLTGVSAPYEEPRDPEVLLDTASMSIDECLVRIREAMVSRGFPG